MTSSSRPPSESSDSDFTFKPPTEDRTDRSTHISALFLWIGVLQENKNQLSDKMIAFKGQTSGKTEVGKYFYLPELRFSQYFQFWNLDWPIGNELVIYVAAPSWNLMQYFELHILFCLFFLGWLFPMSSINMKLYVCRVSMVSGHSTISDAGSDNVVGWLYIFDNTTHSLVGTQFMTEFC